VLCCPSNNLDCVSTIGLLKDDCQNNRCVENERGHALTAAILAQALDLGIAEVDSSRGQPIPKRNQALCCGTGGRPLGFALRDQACNWATMSGDDDLFTSLDPIQQLR